MKSDQRFSGSIGQEYNLFNMAVPHYDSFQKEVGNVLAKYIQSKYEADDSTQIDVYEGGSGTGLTTKILLDSDKRVRVLAIDNEPALMNQAKEYLKEYEDRVVFIEKDLLDALNEIYNINIFVSAFTIHNLPVGYRKSLFDRIGNIMLSGGVYINGDKIARDNSSLHQKDLQDMLDAFKIFTEKGYPELESHWRDHYLEDDEFKLTEREQRDSLKKSGFEDIEFHFRHIMDVIVSAVKAI